MTKPSLGRLAFMALLAVSACLLPALASEGQPEPAANYVFALGAAENFLEAWLHRDKSAGLALTTDRLKAQHEDQESYLTGMSSPTRTAFQIGNGCKVGEDRYRFKAVLLQTLLRSAMTHEYDVVGTHGYLELVGAGSEWKVDEIPNQEGTASVVQRCPRRR